jgi:DNA mismatch repair protein MutS
MSASPPAGLRLTPLYRQYFEIKERHPGAVLFYRMGDFYELFFEDAVLAAPILEVALTSRDKGGESDSPMCGVPHHAVESYITKMVRAGHRVAVCDQVEDPKTAKGIVRREVTRVVSPGTLLDPTFLDGRESSWLAAVAPPEAEKTGAIALLDLTTGEFWGTPLPAGEEGFAALVEFLRRESPRELLYPAGSLDPARGELATLPLFWNERPPEELAPGRGGRFLLEQLAVPNLRVLGLEEGSPLVGAAAAALRYAGETQRSTLPHVDRFAVREPGGGLVLDSSTLANLEVLRSRDDTRRSACLVGVLDQTRSAPGGRLLRAWLARPLSDTLAIEKRQDAVAELVEEEERRGSVRELLGGLGDLERSLARASLPAGGPRDLGAVRDGLSRIPPLRERLIGTRSRLLSDLAASLDPVPELSSLLSGALADELPVQAAAGGVIRPGWDRDLDELRDIRSGSQSALLEIERRERERTGIASLKVRFNRVFGYYIEISKSNLARVPADYDRKQTLVGAERFTTPELKELEEKVLSAEEKTLSRELEILADLRGRTIADAARIRGTARSAAALDALASLAEVAAAGRWARPLVDRERRIEIVGGRHPVVERSLPAGEPFIPNDATLDGSAVDAKRIVVLTGPNMGGKSTFLRQTAQIALLAHAGSFVPADSAKVGLLDRIFTRVGASDNLARGESTFMVEMTETAAILRGATSRSLVILDEVGRGTATFDGLSLAWAIVEHLATDAVCRPLVLFATHYHELTDLARLFPAIQNATMSVREWNDRIIFLRKVVAGSADKSYGIHVARLAGVPEKVLGRAREVLHNLEANELDPHGRPSIARHADGRDREPPVGAQMELFASQESVVLDALRRLVVEGLTPLAALNLVASFQARLLGRDSGEK